MDLRRGRRSWRGASLAAPVSLVLAILAASTATAQSGLPRPPPAPGVTSPEAPSPPAAVTPETPGAPVPPGTREATPAAPAPPAAAPTPPATAGPTAPPAAPVLVTPPTRPEPSIPPSPSSTPASTDAKLTGLTPAQQRGQAISRFVREFKATLYGFVELDTIYDSTESFADLAGNTSLVRPGAYGAAHGRLTFGLRNSRLGVRIESPRFRQILASAVFEVDFLGAQFPGASESVTFTSPFPRLRHGYLKLVTPVVEVLLGQYWQLVGFQPYHEPAGVQIKGIPGQVYARAPQVRVSRLFLGEAVSLELALAASRPPQRDSATPDGQAGIRLLVNRWKGVRTVGFAGTTANALDVAVSGAVRRLSLAAPGDPARNLDTPGWIVSADTFIPIIPATESRRQNALTFTGSYARGAGTADLYTGLNGGLGAPQPRTTLPAPAPAYTPNIDNGLVGFTSTGGIEAVAWQSFLLGLQYYLPPHGEVFVSVNYSRMQSSNITRLANPASVWHRSQWADANVFFDLTPAVRFGLEYAFFSQVYGDGLELHNHRAQFSALYVF